MKSSLVLTLSAISLLTACSSGGNGFNEGDNGDNGGNVPDPGAGATLGITSANALLVTNVSYQAALSSGALAGFSTGTGLLAVDPGGISKIDRAISSKIGNATANPVIPEITEPCLGPLGGTMTFSGEIADPANPLDPLTLTPGDFFNIFYAACDDGFAVIDGNLFYVVDAFNGELASGLYSLTMTATFTDFQVTTVEDELVSNGDVTVRIDTRQFPTLEVEISGASLTVDGTTSAVILTNFASLHAQTGLGPFPYTQTSSGTVDSTMLSGVVSYATPVDFEGFDVDYPSVGEFLVTGNNSSARLIAIDNVNVRIDIDTDGNGTVNNTINTTWAALEGS
jgi:hypothetical protein